MYRTIYLKKQEERRLLAGHLWIYSNEIDTQKSPLNTFTAGEIVNIAQSNNKILGIGYINPHTLLCARLLTHRNEEINQSFFQQRLVQAFALRESLFNEPYYRLVYGESDLLPGLVIDRFNDTLVIQITTAGMEQFAPMLIAALQEIMPIKTIILNNDSEMRRLEQLPTENTVTVGECDSLISVKENDLAFLCDPIHGQKTGWFYDHRDNRAKLAQYVQGKRVLDLFSYAGAWGIHAASYGAAEVICVDSSKQAIELVVKNAELNQVSHKVKTAQADVFDFLKQQVKDQELYDVIIVDPPAFIKKRKDLKNGLLAYQRINEMAMQLLKSNGILVSSSCSMHLAADELKRILLRAGRKLNRHVQLIAQGHQSVDHPIHLAIPETEYLKALFCRVS